MKWVIMYSIRMYMQRAGFIFDGWYVNVKAQRVFETVNISFKFAGKFRFVENKQYSVGSAVLYLNREQSESCSVQL